MQRRRSLLFFLLIALVGALPTAAAAAGAPLPEVASIPPGAKGTPAARVAEDRVLVRFHPGAAPAAVAAEHGLRLGRQVGRTGFRVVHTNGKRAVEAQARLRADRRVAGVALDHVRTKAAVPNDQHYAANQQYLAAAGFERAWDRVKATDDVVVAVLDTGVDLDHPDLVGRLLPGGYDFVGDDAVPADEEGHGTMVAGIAAAETGNGVGVAGAAWGGKVLPVRVLDENGDGLDSDVASGIVWAVDHGADVVNLSLGGPGIPAPEDDVIAAAVAHAMANNVVVVAAAGNGGSNSPHYPAAHRDVIAVGATDATGALAWFSSHGPWVDIAAPGSRVASTTDGGAYGAGPGTSFAAPIVAGAAALLRTQNPGWTPAQVAARLQSTAQDRGPRGVDDYYGWGFLDVAAAVGATPAAPVAVAAADSREPNPTPARAATLSTSATSTIAPEGDVDWYAVAVAGARRLSVTVTATADSDAWRFAMDPVVQVFAPDGTEIASSDEAGSNQAETVVLDVGAGTHLVRVSSYHGSVSPGTYTVTVGTSTAAPTPYPFTDADHVWAQDTSVPTGATGVGTSGPLTVTFRTAMDAASFTAATVQLVDGRTGAVVATSRSYDATTRRLSVTPATALGYQRPYHLRVSGVRDSTGTAMWFDEVVYFTTGAAPPPPPTTTTTTTTVPSTTVPSTTTTTTAPAPPPPPRRSGYWMVDRVGTVYAFGDARHHGDIRGARRNVVDLEPTPSGNGYWLLTEAGEVFSFGDARHAGQPAGGFAPGEVVTSMSANPKGAGYWLFTTRGRVLAYGAPHFGDMFATVLNGPVLDSVSTPSGNGYYMVASDGGIFTFGDARFYGSMGGKRLNQPVQSLVPDGDGVGYWLVASDGGIFSFEAPFRGSMGSTRLNRPVTGMVRFGNGYMMVGEDGGIFNFSDKPFHGSLGSNPPPNPVVSVGGLDG